MGRNRWLVLAVLFFARTAMGFQFQSVAAVSPLLVAGLGIDFALLGALIGAWMLPGVALALPAGLLGRRFGDKAVVLAGLALMAAGSFALGAAQGYPLAVAARVVAGVGAVLLNVLLTKMVADWFAGRGLATAMGVLVMSWPLGIGLALATLGPLAAAASWSLAMHVAGWACAASLLAIAALYQPPLAAAAAPERQSARAGGAISARELAFAGLAGSIWTLYNVAYILVVSFMPLLLAEKGYAAASAAFVASFAAWPLVATIPLGGMLADRIGHGHAIMLASMLAMALGVPLMLLGVSPLPMLALIGIVMGPAAGIIMALPARVLAPQARHLGMGLFYSVYYLGMALLPAVAGWLRERTGVAGAPLFFSTALLLLAMVLAEAFRRWQARPN